MTTEEDDDYSPAQTHWFGTPWPRPELPASVCGDDKYKIETPVDAVCFPGCGEPIRPWESGVRLPYTDGTGSRSVYEHAECFLRDVVCPFTMGLLKGAHVHDPERRRDEGRLMMAHAAVVVR